MKIALRISVKVIVFFLARISLIVDHCRKFSDASTLYRESVSLLKVIEKGRVLLLIDKISVLVLMLFGKGSPVINSSSKTKEKLLDC